MSRMVAGGAAALRLVAWIAALGLIALPIVGVTRGWFASERWPLRQLRIDAPFDRVTAEQIRAAAAPHAREGFFAVRLDRVRAAVETLPWVERAEARKRWPDRLEITVRERVAIASWDGRRLVSETGELFEVPGETVPEGLPALSGPADRVLEVVAFHRDAVERLRGSGLLPIGTTLSARGSWTLTLVSGAPVVVGRETPHERLARFAEAATRIDGAQLAALLRADLRYANGFAVHWAPLPEPAPARTPAAPEADPAATAADPAQNT